MIEAYSSFWNNILDFSGTASRKYYWWPVIINYIIGGILVAAVQSIIGHPIDDIYNWTDLSLNVASQIIIFLVWLATLSVKFRRLHDTDHSGWWVLVELVPIIGSIWFLILMLLPSKINRWSNN